MDFLKTLLAYMALLTTLSVQEGPAPQSVPTPTPLPSHVTASPVPHQTAAPTASPSPTPDPTPAMTANKRYSNLVFGDSGSNVKKLQNALIKLGYMPKGSADGQYGYQTYNAVKAFQKANILEVDGVAGPMTLTCLYDNPAVIGVAEETPVPTATPTPSLPPLPELPASAETAPLADMLTKLDGAYVISGTDGKALYRETLINGQPALVKAELWLDGDGVPMVSLAQLTDCMNGWALMGSSADRLWALHACGYTVSIQLTDDEPSILVDGKAVAVADGDVHLADGVLYVTDAFLKKTLQADTVFDADEKSLVVFFQDKSVAGAQD